MSCLFDLVKPYVEKLVDVAVGEARHVFCFTCIVKEFEEERSKLEPQRLTLEQHVKLAKDRGKVITTNASSWEEDMKKLLEVDTKTKQTCFFEFCPNCIWRYKKGKELVAELELIKQLKENVLTLEKIQLPGSLPDVERFSLQDYISFKSRESKYEDLLKALKDDNNYITKLQGMGGTGKTTLAQKVGKELKQSGQFTRVIDTTVSFTPDIKKIQDEIAGSLGLEWENCNESDRPKKLWSRLTSGEKILLIMDDLWDENPPDFDAIGIPKQDTHKGFRVLVTTRSKQVFKEINFNISIELELLSEDDAWIMFKRYAGISDSSSKKVIGKGRKIVKECKQLPVAIAVTARSLKGQQERVHEWDVALNSLKNPASMDGVNADMVGIYNCLKFSYDHMKDEKAKRLFLLCSVFPEDEEISNEVLARLCIGAGIFGDNRDTYNAARGQVFVAKDRLVDSCLLLEADEKHVKMHDLIRDVGQWIAKKEFQEVNLSDKNQKSLVERETNIRCLFCKGKDMDLFSCKFADGSKLETLIVIVDNDEDYECLEVPNSFFVNIVKLRVLYFLGNDERSLSLPNSIRSLTKIRSMLVYKLDLGDISVLENLESLETLDLVKCIIKHLPRGISKLKKFKLLNLKKCEIEMNNPFEVIGRCSSLEELYFAESFNDFCGEITLPELQRYRISKGKFYSGSYNDVMEGSLKHVNLQGDGDKVYFSQGTLKFCMQTAEVFRLTEMNIQWRNLMPEIVPINLGMNDLFELSLQYDSHLQCLIDTKLDDFEVPNVFSNLVTLELIDMEKLQELCTGPISLVSLNNLEEMHIERCKNLRSLFNCSLNLCNLNLLTLKSCSTLVSIFDLSTSRSLLLLESLIIFDCEQLENIIAYERSVGDTIEEIVDGDNDNNNSSNSMFPKLKIFNIRGCPKLQFILPFLSARDLLLLETIAIGGCDNLKYIFAQHQDVKLSSLIKLSLCGLPNFIDIFPESRHSTPLSIKGSSSIYKDSSRPQTQLDPVKCNIFSWSHLCCYQSQDFPISSMEPNSYFLNIWEHVQCFSRQIDMCNIKMVELVNIPRIKSVFILSTAPRMLLERLIITKCDELKHVIIDSGDHNSGGNNWGNVFPKLKELSINECMQLEYIIGH